MPAFRRVSRLCSFACLFVLSFATLPAQAVTYYIDSVTGNDGNDGRTPNSAWRSVSTVNGRSFNQGDDLRLRAGSVFENQELQISWGGSNNNWVTVDCYDVVNGNAVECSDNANKPEINGNFEEWCAASRQCPFNQPGAIPQSVHTGLINVYADYVELKNLRIRDSGGFAVLVAGTHSSSRRFFNAESLEINHLASAIIVLAHNIQNAVVRDTHAQWFALCAQYRYADCSGGGWPAGIIVHDSPNSMVLFENNLVHDGFGEAFNCLRATHVVMRGNRAGSIHSNAYYLDHCSNSLVENNIAWGDLANNWGANLAFAGVNIGNEDYPGGGRESINNTIRNNLITGFGYCVDASQWQDAINRGYRLGFHMYGNTCIGMKRQNIAIYPTTNVDEILVQNNIFYSPGTSEAICTTANDSSRVTFSSNLWNSGNKDARCESPSDIIGDPQVVSSLAKFNTFDSLNQPTPQDFALRPNSPVLGSGTQLLDTHFQVFDELRNVVANATECQEDDNGLERDYHCVDRQFPPSLGAIDRVRYPPLPPTISIQ